MDCGGGASPSFSLFSSVLGYPCFAGDFSRLMLSAFRPPDLLFLLLSGSPLSCYSEVTSEDPARVALFCW